MLIGVVGDCTLDVTVARTGPMSQGGDVRAQISLAPGGQAANVSVRLARRGARVRLVAPIADDASGQILAAHLAAEAVEVVRLPAARTAMVVAMVGAGGERSMLSDRIALDGDIASALRDADWVHCSGYALRNRPEADRVVADLRASGIRHISVGGGSFEDGADAVTAREAIDVLDACLVVFDRDEASLLAGETSRAAAQAASQLATQRRLVVVTDARRGSAAAGLGLSAPMLIPASLAATPTPPPAAPRDATGAGDAFAAALLTGLADAWPPSVEAIRAALAEASSAGADATQVSGAQGRLASEPDAPLPRFVRGRPS